ncbi:MAG: hypothetical protein M1500_00295 [Candidatus Marsarchaeota archaeon]|nr:hypothetical protein [Candidatus Marsarchaeota archaeon]MCL5112146.1 hypothetical protein [Candidatus Marsarchaeota archaeon]
MSGAVALVGSLFPLLSSFSSVRSDLLPLVFLAIALDIGIVGLWYAIGVVLQNNSVKKSAVGELYQAFGTAVIAFIVLFTVLTFSSVFYQSLDATTLMNHTTMSSMCTNLESNSMLSLLNNSKGSVLETQTNNGICDIVSKHSTVTQQADYPLAASGVVIANLTNQSVQNLNSLFVFDAYLGFLEKLAPSMAWCVGTVVQCATPLTPGPPFFMFTFSAKPYAGYRLIYSSANQLIVLFSTAIESFVAQLVMIQVFLYAWPWLLFAGLLLRATFFTRRIGGLLIAVAIGAIIIYPTVFSIEYLSLGNGVSSGYNSTYGFNSITNLPLSGGPYTLNFFVQPKMSDVLNDNGNGCYITGSNPITTMEETDAGWLLVPFSSVYSGIAGSFGAFVSSAPSFPLPYPSNPGGSIPPNGNACKPSEASALVFKVAEAYGISGVTAYFLPIINIIITLSAIIGLSGLMGGDTSLAGLGKFI